MYVCDAASIPMLPWYSTGEAFVCKTVQILAALLVGMGDSIYPQIPRMKSCRVIIELIMW